MLGTPIAGRRACVTSVSPKNQYLNPSQGTFWLCTSGLTPCVSTNVLLTTNDSCIIVDLMPRITYLPPDMVPLMKHPTRSKRELATITLAVLLGLGVAGGVGTGTAALVTRYHSRQQLLAAVNQYL